MGLFDFLKKKATVEKQQPQATKVEKERLTPEGELPWGWVTRNKEFCDRITGEFLYFSKALTESQHKAPREHHSALKSFVLYLEDVEKLCKSKGECFEYWFREILTCKGYMERIKKELKDLTANLDELQANYNKRNNELSDLDNRIINMLICNPGILQSEFVKRFDPLIQNDVREKLYSLEKAGKLEKTKSGRSYTLHYKK